MHASALHSPDGWPLDGEPGLPINRERGHRRRRCSTGLAGRRPRWDASRDKRKGARGLADRRTFVLRRKGGKLSSRSLGGPPAPPGLLLRRSRAPPLTSPQRGDAIEPWAPLTSPRMAFGPEDIAEGDEGRLSRRQGRAQPSGRVPEGTRVHLSCKVGSACSNIISGNIISGNIFSSYTKRGFSYTFSQKKEF